MDSDLDFVINLSNENIKKVNFRLLDKQNEINELKYIKFYYLLKYFVRKAYISFIIILKAK